MRLFAYYAASVRVSGCEIEESQDRFFRVLPSGAVSDIKPHDCPDENAAQR